MVRLARQVAQTRDILQSLKLARESYESAKGMALSHETKKVMERFTEERLHRELIDRIDTLREVPRT